MIFELATDTGTASLAVGVGRYGVGKGLVRRLAKMKRRRQELDSRNPPHQGMRAQTLSTAGGQYQWPPRKSREMPAFACIWKCIAQMVVTGYSVNVIPIAF